jgi:hypothetical protein
MTRGIAWLLAVFVISVGARAQNAPRFDATDDLRLRLMQFYPGADVGPFECTSADDKSKHVCHNVVTFVASSGREVGVNYLIMVSPDGRRFVELTMLMPSPKEAARSKSDRLYLDVVFGLAADAIIRVTSTSAASSPAARVALFERALKTGQSRDGPWEYSGALSVFASFSAKRQP